MHIKGTKLRPTRTVDKNLNLSGCKTTLKIECYDYDN